MTNKMIVASLLVPILCGASQETATATMRASWEVMLPTLTSEQPRQSRLDTLWNTFWPSSEQLKLTQFDSHTGATKGIITDSVLATTARIIHEANSTLAWVKKGKIDPFCTAKANRLAIGTLGFWLMRGYRSLNPNLSFVNGLTQIYSKTSRSRLLTIFGLVAGSIAAAKWVAPFFIKQWETYKLDCQFNAYEKKLGQALTSALGPLTLRVQIELAQRTARHRHREGSMEDFIQIARILSNEH